MRLDPKDQLMSFGRAVYTRIADVPLGFRAKLHTPAPRQVDPTNTGGFDLPLVELPRNIAFGLYLDRYTGPELWRFWYGFWSPNGTVIRQLFGLTRKAGYRRQPLHKTTGDYARTENNTESYLTLKPALKSDDFDRIVHEEYPTYPLYFLGIYLPYPPPLATPKIRIAAQEACNFLVSFMRALAVANEPTVSDRRTTPSPEVEQAAVIVVQRHLQDRGYEVRSRETENCGYDLHASKFKRELHVEVKGTAGSMERFFLTRNELDKAKHDPNWRLALVTNALSRTHQLKLYKFESLEKNFDIWPIGWEYRAK